ncbi:hypothetical protein YWIDRAFT_08204, partial [Streptomyces sp. SceaMP-e96]
MRHLHGRQAVWVVGRQANPRADRLSAP